MKFDWDDKAIAKFVENAVPDRLTYDPSKSEAQQLNDLEKQFKKNKGVVPSRSELRGILRSMKKAK